MSGVTSDFRLCEQSNLDPLQVVDALCSPPKTTLVSANRAIWIPCRQCRDKPALRSSGQVSANRAIWIPCRAESREAGIVQARVVSANRAIWIPCRGVGSKVLFLERFFGPLRAVHFATT